MNNLQILQNKAAKIVLDRPYFSSATDHIFHRQQTNREIHNYNTRYKDNLRPPKVSRNWGKQRLAYQAITDWNNLDRKIKLSTSISTFKRNFFSNL